MTIILNTLDRVKKFGDIASKFDSDIDVIRNKYIVDGKSIWEFSLWIYDSQ